MTASTINVEATFSPEFQQQLAEHRREVQRLRAEFGDPAEALSQFVRDHFSPEAFKELELSTSGYSYLFEDDEE